MDWGYHLIYEVLVLSPIETGTVLDSLHEIITMLIIICWRNPFWYIDALAWWGYQLTNTLPNVGAHTIYEILHIKNQIVCCIETYFILSYYMSKCSTPIETGFGRILYAKPVFWHQLVFHKYHLSCFNPAL